MPRWLDVRVELNVTVCEPDSDGSGVDAALLVSVELGVNEREIDCELLCVSDCVPVACCVWEGLDD